MYRQKDKKAPLSQILMFVQVQDLEDLWDKEKHVFRI